MWQKRYAVPQKQAGYFLVHIPLFLGDIEADRFEQLAAIVAEYGEGVLRTTQQQNLVLRWIHQDELPEVHARLKAIGLAGLESSLLSNMIACAGASTCRLGICLSRGLAKAIRSRLSANGTSLDGLDALKISISGCPNSCGRHPLADIGLFGAARRANGQLVPQYVVQLGGRVGVGRTRLAQGQEAVPARNVPALVAELLASVPSLAAFSGFRTIHRCRGFADRADLGCQSTRPFPISTNTRSITSTGTPTSCSRWPAAGRVNAVQAFSI